MNREIKCRGLTLIHGEWTYGVYTKYDANCTFGFGEIHGISYYDGNSHCSSHVHANTVGQYIGEKDSNDVEIYDGDIIEFSYLNTELQKNLKCRGVVIYTSAAFCLTNDDGLSMAFEYKKSDWTVIGNIYENPDIEVK